VVTCPICENRFDERAYQVVVVGLGSFDSIACAEAALRVKARERKKLARDPAGVSSSGERDWEPSRMDQLN
jgi:hypothetical protein